MPAAGEVTDVVPFDRFEITNVVPQGTSELAAHAYDTETDRRVFLKVIDPENEKGRLRMLREANVLESLDHPRIPRLFGVECSDDFAYIATEPMLGSPTVAQKLKKNGPKPEAVAAFGASALDALAHVHERGLVHRDVKTSNLVLRYGGVASLVDFELAIRPIGILAGMLRVSGESTCSNERDTRITDAGQVAGTSGYMAPEQMISGSALPAGDIYGIGTMMHELLSGTVPFVSYAGEKVTTGELAGRKIEFADGYLWQSKRAIPPVLQCIVEKALCPSVSERYATAGDMKEDLERYLANQQQFLPEPHVEQSEAADECTCETEVLAVAA